MLALSNSSSATGIPQLFPGLQESCTPHRTMAGSKLLQGKVAVITGAGRGIGQVQASAVICFLAHVQC